MAHLLSIMSLAGLAAGTALPIQHIGNDVAALIQQDTRLRNDVDPDASNAETQLLYEQGHEVGEQDGIAKDRESQSLDQANLVKEREFQSSQTVDRSGMLKGAALSAQILTDLLTPLKKWLSERDLPAGAGPLQEALDNVTVPQLMEMAQKLLAALRNETFVDALYETVDALSGAFSELVLTTDEKFEAMASAAENKTADEALKLMRKTLTEEGAAVGTLSEAVAKAVVGLVEAFPKNNTFAVPSLPIATMASMKLTEQVNKLFASGSADFCGRLALFIDNQTVVGNEISEQYIPALSTFAQSLPGMEPMIAMIAADVVPVVTKLMNSTVEVAAKAMSSVEGCLRREIGVMTKIGQKNLECKISLAGAGSAPCLLLVLASLLASFLLSRREP